MGKLEDFEKMGGRSTLERINSTFYDKVYKHPWLKLYFEKIDQQHIEDQQTDFMQMVLGGANVYVGKTPPNAHPHMFVSEELFEERQKLLVETFKELRVHPELQQKWLAIDEAFKDRIVKKSPAQCVPRFKSDPVLNFPNPVA